MSEQINHINLMNRISDIEKREELLEREVSLDIVEFIQDKIRRNSNRDALRNAVNAELLSYLEDEEKRKNLTFTQLMNLLAILNKDSEALANNVLNILENRRDKRQTKIEEEKIQFSDTELSKEEIQKAKEKRNLINKVESDKELKKKILFDKLEYLENSEFDGKE
jgi:hypothetical protein